MLLLAYLGRESNPNLIFRRDLFYPLNYQGLLKRNVLMRISLFCTAKIQQLFSNVKSFIHHFNPQRLFFLFLKRISTPLWIALIYFNMKHKTAYK